MLEQVLALQRFFLLYLAYAHIRLARFEQQELIWSGPANEPAQSATVIC